jgi:uncharacterized protein YggE
MRLRWRLTGLMVGGTLAFVVAATTANAQMSMTDRGSMRTLRVVGHAEAKVTPDEAFLNLAIETHALTAQECASLNADLAQKVVKALEAKLDKKGRVWTGGYSLYPEYSNSSGGKKPAIEGYRAENSITVQTQGIDLLGMLIDTAIAAGANRINYLNFDIQDDSRPRAEAITMASRDAQAQAQALAASLGVKLKQVIEASTVAEPRPIPMMRMHMMATMASTPVQPSEVSVPATVTLEYEIE